MDSCNRAEEHKQRRRCSSDGLYPWRSIYSWPRQWYLYHPSPSAHKHSIWSILDVDGVKYAEKGIILVTINYRLGLFGFFAHKQLTELSPNFPTNFGLLDQIVALKWIKRYITHFGGNPNDITVFGTSNSIFIPILFVLQARVLEGHQFNGLWLPKSTL